MDINSLMEKIEKAEAKVEKCKKTIERHEKQLEKKLDKASKYGVTLDNLKEMREKYRGTDTSWELFEVEGKISDIKGATKKLKEAEIILENWKNKLNIEIEKDKFLEGSVPQVIKDFLEQWKQLAYEWHIKRYDSYQSLRKQLQEEEQLARIEAIKTLSIYANYLNEDGELKYSVSTVHPYKPMNEFLKERNLDNKSIKERLNMVSNFVVLKMCEYKDETERLAYLEKEIEREKKAKMLDLINRINAVVGTITDASGLRVSEKGNLDGIIVGEKGSAKVETIGVGGWNIQCFHYRTLVHKIS